MNYHDDLDCFFAENAFAQNTDNAYRQYLTRFLNWVDEQSIEVSEITAQQFKSWLFIHEWANSTRYLAYNAIRAFLKWKYGQNHPARRMKFRRKESEPQRTLSSEQIQKLFDSINPRKAKGSRDLALFALMLDTGLRASEVTSLELKHLNIAERSVSVRVKGGRWGVGVFSPDTRLCLQAWLGFRDEIARSEAKTVFVAIGGIRPGTRLTSDGLRCIFRQRAQRAGIALFSPHDMRRTFATLSLRNGAPTRIVQKAGRWKRIQMVELYTRAIRPQDFEPYFPTTAIFKKRRKSSTS